MARGKGEDYDMEDDVEEEEAAEEEEEEEEEEEDRGGKGSKRRWRSEFIDDAAEEDDEEEDEDEGYGSRRRKQMRKSQFIDDEAFVDSDGDEEEEEEGEEDFINDTGAELPEDGGRRVHRKAFPSDDEQEEDVEDLERRIQDRYRPKDLEEFEDVTEVEQQALLPSIKDSKLWMVKCAIGHEREIVICLMQKSIDKPELQIKSAIALDHLNNYIYVEADKEAHVKEACKGLRNIYSSAKILPVPIKEMPDVLSVESKTVDLSRDTWVRMKTGIYKGDLAKVVDVDNVRHRVHVKLIPRIDLQNIANKLDGRDTGKKKTFVPPPRFFNADEAKELHIRVERRRDKDSGEYYESVDNMMFKDGFLYKTFSTKSIYSQNIQPTFDELEKFKKPDDANLESDSLSTSFANRKKGHFMKGDAVIVVRGDLRNLMGWVEKVEEGNVHIRPKMEGLSDAVAVSEKDLCKYFKPGDHVKVVSGVQEGATGMVVKVEGNILTLLSDTTKEDIRVFADIVVESSEVTTGITRIGDYELHDLVLLDDKSFGVIIRVESEAFQVLKGVPDRPEVVLIKLREIRSKLDRPGSALDKKKNRLLIKDVVKVVEGPCKGRQGSVERIYRGIIFIYDRHHLEHAGFICVLPQSCVIFGGSQGGHDRNVTDPLDSRFAALRNTPNINSPRRTPSGRPPIDNGGRGRGFGRGHDPLVGKSIKIRAGPFKGYRGLVKQVKGIQVQVELDSQMKSVMVKREDIADAAGVVPGRSEMPRHRLGSETPTHQSRTPLHPYQTPLRDSGATPAHEGMRTPMRDRAWAPMSPPRDHWEEGNPGSWGNSPAYQLGTPPIRTYEAPTPGSGWAATPGGNYGEAETARESSPYANAASPYVPSTTGQPMTPSSYLPGTPGTPGGQPMTPGTSGFDVMSPVIGEGEGNWIMTDILVNVQKLDGGSPVAVVREVLPDGSCRVALGSSGIGDVLTVTLAELEVVRPIKSDKVKVLSGTMRGHTGKLIGIDGSDGIVKLDYNLEVKIVDLVILAKLAT